MITLSMIVKNEEKYLRGCLESVKGVVDEIVIVDTGSTDRTLEIAKEFNANIYHFDWIKDFSAARNYALDKSTKEWILYLDADERLTKESGPVLKKLGRLKNDHAYECTINNIDEVTKKPALMTYYRFFPNKPEIRFIGKVHEQIGPSLVDNNYKISPSKILIDHLGYNIQNQDLKNKAKRNLEILLTDYQDNPTSYNAYQLGQTHAILEDKEKAIKYFVEALNDEKLRNEFKSLALRYLAIHFAEIGDYEKASTNIDLAIKSDKNQPFNYLAKAKIYYKQKEYAPIQKLYLTAFDLNNKLMNKKITTAQNNFIFEDVFIYDALTTALLINNKEFYNNFYNLFKEKINKNHSEIELFNKLFNNKELSDIEIIDLKEISNSNNIELILTLLNNYNVIEIKLKTIQSLYQSFNRNSLYLNKAAKILSELGLVKEAISFYEESFSIKEYEDPSIIFFLVSLYIKNNELNKINDLLLFGERKFKNHNAIIERLQQLRNKLTSIL